MIYWFTGQPGSGKTSLALELKKVMEKDRLFTYYVHHLDGDNVRELFQNKDYSEKGRRYNVDTVQKIAHYLHLNGNDVIVSLVSPYRDQRENFKEIIGEELVEIYTYATEKRPRDEFKVENYEPPQNNYISLDTTGRTAEKNMKLLVQNL